MKRKLAFISLLVLLVSAVVFTACKTEPEAISDETNAESQVESATASETESEEEQESETSAGRFVYQHDPRENPSAMADIVADETAIYGFRPNETGSLSIYADADWSDPDVVEKGRQDRIAYHQSLESMYDLLAEMTEEGKSTEEIARALSALRNQMRLASYENDPEGLAKLKERNLQKYGHEEGPLADELYEQYGSWEMVISKSFSANSGMDACLGLYDDYYDLYVSVGQVSR